MMGPVINNRILFQPVLGFPPSETECPKNKVKSIRLLLMLHPLCLEGRNHPNLSHFQVNSIGKFKKYFNRISLHVNDIFDIWER